MDLEDFNFSERGEEEFYTELERNKIDAVRQYKGKSLKEELEYLYSIEKIFQTEKRFFVKMWNLIEKDLFNWWTYKGYFSKN